LDVYEHSGLVITFFLLFLPKFILVTFFNLIIIEVFNDIDYYNEFVIFFSLISAFINNIIAIYQVKIKKLLVCLSFANITFFILPLYLQTIYSFISFFSFFFIYFFNFVGIFIFLIYMQSWIGTRNLFFKKISFLISLANSNKIFSYLILTLFLSISGLPPFSGFFAKFFLLYIATNENLFYLFIILSIINLFSIFVCLRLIKLLFQRKKFQPKLIAFGNNSIFLLYLFVIISLINIFFIFFFDLLFNFIIIFILNLEWIN
jgi:NADH-quinone oxidoreductase subunit N